MKPVRVVWFDAVAQATWHEREEIEEFVEKGPLRIESLGWLVKLKEDCVVLAMSISEKTASELLTIPLGAVEEIHYF